MGCTLGGRWFGVTYTGLHATDERIQLDTIHAVYHATLLSLLTAEPDV